MTLIATEANEYPVEIQLLEEGERVRGGEDGPDNRALKQLANRTHWLKLQLENLPTPEPGGGDSNLPPLPEGVPYWSFLGAAATVAEVKAKPVEGYPDYSYYLCQGHVWAIVESVWTDMGSFVPPSSGGGGPVLPEGIPNWIFVGVISDPAQLEGLPPNYLPEYSYVLAKGHMWAYLQGEWRDFGSFEGAGGGGGGGGTPFPEAPVDGTPYARQDEDWVKVDLNARKSKDLVEVSTVDPNKGVFYKLDNTLPTKKTITLVSGPGMTYPYEDYGIVVTLIVNGIVGELEFKTENGAALLWHKGPQPILYAQRTVFILMWTGDEWFGSTGAQIPT